MGDLFPFLQYEASEEVNTSIADDGGNANILKSPTRNLCVAPWTSFGRTNTSTPASPPLKRGMIQTPPTRPRFPLNEGDTKTSPKFCLSLFVLVPTR